MFLADGLVLAHSKAENGVKKVDAAMTVFKEPVTWENGKFVRVIVTIAAEDQQNAQPLSPRIFLVKDQGIDYQGKKIFCRKL